MRALLLPVIAFMLVACVPPALKNSPHSFPAQTSQPAVVPTMATLPSGNPTTPSNPTSKEGTLIYVKGSTQKICQLVGETDREFNQPTVNQTESRFGLAGNDLGYSFEYNGKLFFLFGDSIPTATFNGKPNLGNASPRTPNANDAIAFTTGTNINQCLQLNFIVDSIGAYKNPVVLNSQGQPAITLRDFEVPVAGISDGGKMYVIFATDHVAPGFATRTVVGESDDDANTFHYLYDFSKGPDARFINVAVAAGNDGYVYFWGTQGGSLYRKSPPFLARKPIGSMNSLNGIEYLHTISPDGTPAFTANEGEAMPLFHDTVANAAGQSQVSDCMGELGVEWNQFLKRWMMLYNCLNDTPANPRGIYMRYAPNPWGPWSTAQTIFNPITDNGYCHFMHRAVNAQNPTACDNLSDPARLDVFGGEYAPYFISRFTTGDANGTTSTFYYTLSTWNPYTEVIMKTTVQLQTP